MFLFLKSKQKKNILMPDMTHFEREKKFETPIMSNLSQPGL
jgi:hypothetical protein